VSCPTCHQPFESPDFDPRCSTCTESSAGANLAAAPICVDHASLEKMSENSCFLVACPKCQQGLLLVRRNLETWQLQRTDMCTLCGQRFVYTDAEIAGERLKDG
jgi:hypothetical protein